MEATTWIERVDVAVIGAGPIGRALAAGLAARGVFVRCIEKAADAPWYPNYGIWRDDADAIGLTELAYPGFSEPLVVGPDGTRHALARPYAMVDRQALRARLDAAIGSDALVCDEVIAADDRDEVHLTLASGRSLRAAIVLDARGRTSPLVRHTSEREPAWQTAWGADIRVRGGIDPERLVLMDWSHRFDDGGPPGFLYAVPQGDGVLFVEETVLAARPAFPLERLRSRLEQRLRAMGVDYDWTGHGEERCRIAMGAALPSRGGRVIPFGAAAGMVHPASGYLLGHGLRFAEQAAASIADALQAGRDPVHAAWDGAWPSDRRRMWGLYLYGLEIVLKLEHDELGKFFDAFFSLPTERWAAFLSARGGSREVARTMTAFFARAPWSIRRRLIGL